MDAQNGIIFVIAIAMISVLIVVTLGVRKSGRARQESLMQAEHEEHTRNMTSRLADTGTEWRIEQDKANGKSDIDDPVDQSIEAQLNKLV